MKKKLKKRIKIKIKNYLEYIFKKKFFKKEYSIINLNNKLFF